MTSEGARDQLKFGSVGGSFVLSFRYVYTSGTQTHFVLPFDIQI